MTVFLQGGRRMALAVLLECGTELKDHLSI